MTTTLRRRLAAELDALREAGTYKRFNTLCSPQGPLVEMEGRGEVLVLSSNNYLGLADRPEVVEAGIEGLRRYGAGTASVRFICGTFEPHLELERELAELVGTEAALTYVSCWNANEAAIPSLTDDSTVILSDELNHASIIDAVRLARPARKAVYKHSDMDDLRAQLESLEPGQRALVITDGVFSMEGDLAKLPELVELVREHDATLVVDDSHGTGVDGRDGPRRRRALRPARRDRRDHLDAREGARRRGRRVRRGERGGLRHPRPALAAAALLERPAADRRLLGAGGRARAAPRAGAGREAARRRPRSLRGRLRELGFRPLDGEAAIVPIIVGETAFAIRFSERLLEEGVFVTGFGYPVVPEGTARVRVQMSAAIEPEHIERALAAFEKVGRELDLIQSETRGER